MAEWLWKLTYPIESNLNGLNIDMIVCVCELTIQYSNCDAL